ncbi:uncharacterized protein LOC119615114 [Lucilia sericata]|uniref:uncharacterized protein LOC119615114 n=1 Tax=Lucilia sericata TaxID=13632 RepID=UPI0018A8030C|nr:uncharacterized protein LOC119615114 [Lucilia sericata]
MINQNTKQHQQQQHHYYYFANYTTENKNVQEEISDGNNVDDFYHIKQCCYQPTTTIKSRTLNQRNQYILTTTTITTATSTTTSNAETLTTTPTTTTLSHVLHSLSSYNCRSSFVTVFLMGYLLLVQHYAMAAPQSCILCDKNDLQAKDPQTNYEEFLFEHQVTRQDAINALRQLNESFYEGTASDSSCNGVRCTEKVMKYVWDHNL